MVRKKLYEWDLPLDVRPRLKKLVCREYKCTEEELLDKSKKRHLVDARKAYVSIARYGLKDSLPKIGQMLGRDHTTIMNLINRVADDEFLKSPNVAVVKKIKEELFNQL
jgi:chromosomal replication initiation ATPase DnaA